MNPVNNTAIPIKDINSVPQVFTPTSTVNPFDYTSPINQVQTDIFGGVQNAQNQVNQLTEQAKQKSSSIATLESLLGNKAQDTTNLYDTTGVTNLYNQLSDLNAQATGLKNEAAAIPIQVQQQALGQGVTDRGIAPIETAKLRDNALKALSLGQQYAIVSGNYDKARNYADQLITAKYSQIEANINARKTDLAALEKYDLTPAQTKLLNAQNAAIKKQEQELADKKANEKGINDIAIEVAKNGGDVNVLKNAKTVSEAIQLAASSLKTPNTEVIKLGDKAAYLIDKTTGKIIKSFGGYTSNNTDSSNTGLTNIANPKLAGVVDTILASGKFTKDQAGVIRKAINNGENPTTVIKNNAKNIMGQTEATKLTNYESTKSAMIDLKNSINAYYAAGGETSLFKGNFEKVINRLGEVKDPKLASLAVEIQANLQSYRNAISGTAYSDQEGQDIASVFPGINKSKQLNDAIFAGRDRALDSSINGLYKAALGENIYKQVKDIESGVATNISKGSLDDRSFVEKAVKSQSIPYDKLVNDTPAGYIPVVDNKTGEVGYLPINEYNPSNYTKL